MSLFVRGSSKNYKLADLPAANAVNVANVDLSNEGLNDFPLLLLEAYQEHLQFINLGGNHLSELSLAVSSFQSLSILFFAQNSFSSIPSLLGKLPNLRMLSFKSNKVVQVPEDCLSRSLRWLILTDNSISNLPASIGMLSGLRKLMLAGNQLTKLPEELQQCHELELVRLSLNQLSDIPRWLLEMPRLSWLAYSGNPVCASTTIDSATTFSWSSVQVIKQLGEGASGQVFEVLINDVPRAMKVYRGAVTSDGMAEDEITACLQAGKHANLVEMHGIIRDHPSGNLAIVMDLLDLSKYQILGFPPSFDSITRDTFGDDTRCSISFITNVAHGIANVCAHLHEHGIMHGDLYAHNILVDTEGFPILTDFGAASLKTIFAIDSVEYQLLEKIELRAYGCLLDDLLQLLYQEEKNGPKFTRLCDLRDICMSESIYSRPTFAAICLA